MNIGKKIYELRKTIGLSQMQLAEKLSVSRQTISNWELGQTVPDIIQANELASIFNVSLDELVDNDVKDVLVKKVINTEKMISKIKNILESLIILIVAWTIIMIVTICVIKIQIQNVELSKNEEINYLNSFIKSSKVENYLCKLNGVEMRFAVYCTSNNIVNNIGLSSYKLDMDDDIQKKSLEEMSNFSHKYSSSSGKLLDEFFQEAKEFFESKGGEFEHLSNPFIY